MSRDQYADGEFVDLFDDGYAAGQRNEPPSEVRDSDGIPFPERHPASVAWHAGHTDGLKDSPA